MWTSTSPRRRPVPTCAASAASRCSSVMNSCATRMSPSGAPRRHAATGGGAVTPESLEEGHAELIERLADATD